MLTSFFFSYALIYSLFEIHNYSELYWSPLLVRDGEALQLWHPQGHRLISFPLKEFPRRYLPLTLESDGWRQSDTYSYLIIRDLKISGSYRGNQASSGSRVGRLGEYGIQIDSLPEDNGLLGGSRALAELESSLAKSIERVWDLSVKIVLLGYTYGTYSIWILIESRIRGNIKHVSIWMSAPVVSAYCLCLLSNRVSVRVVIWRAAAKHVRQST